MSSCQIIAPPAVHSGCFAFPIFSGSRDRSSIGIETGFHKALTGEAGDGQRFPPNAKKQGQFGYGDVWTWTAICADTKLIPAWLVADRGAGAAWEFMQDLAPRLANRVQLTTDGHKVYVDAVDEAFRGKHRLRNAGQDLREGHKRT